METLIEDLKKVMNSEIENKEKYMKMLINGFLRERDTKLLTIQGVVTSKKVSDIVCKALYDQYDFEIRRYPDDSVSSINEDEVIKFVKRELR